MERKVVKTYSAESGMQAEVILDTFGGNQIPACKKDVGSSRTMNVHGTNFPSGKEIYVTEEDAKRVLEVLGGIGL